MAWPALSDFQDAIQNPQFCFADGDLRSGTPVYDRMGLPKPISGNFASVYEMKCAGAQYAARCFLRADLDQGRAARYAKIDQYLRDVGLPYTVAFEYLARGIRVRGEWYPILKMEWLAGDTLDVFVRKNRLDSALMCELSRQFLQLTIDLRSSSIAHGDLQHGNILVVDENLRVIDYDGMYVPGLEGLPSEEIGHRNYQDPRRTTADFGPDLDNFSAWVIFLSLLAVSRQPGLWDTLNGGEECLLFRQEDFENPQSSMAFRALDTVQDDQLRQLVSSFQQYAASSWGNIPPLEKHWADHVSPVPTAWLLPVSPASEPNSGVPRWLSELMAIGLCEEPRERYEWIEGVREDLQGGRVTTTIECGRCGAESDKSLVYCANCEAALLRVLVECCHCEKFIPCNCLYCPCCGGEL